MATLLAPQLASAQVVRLLVAAGQNDGLAQEVPLAYAEADAARFGDVFRDLGGASRVWLVTDARPDSLAAAFAKARAEAERHAPEDVQLLFYFSGHADRVDLHLDGERFAQLELDRLVQSVPAGLRLTVIDACQSDPDLLYKGGFGRAPAFAVDLSAPKSLSGSVKLLSSSPGEASQESQRLGGAVFTHYLLSALRGAGDKDGDSQVTLGEAYAFAYGQTVRRSAQQGGNVMHPQVDMDLEGAGALVLTTASKRQARLQLPAGRDDQYLVFAQPAGTVMAELWSQPDRQLALSVPPGRYLVTRRGASGSAATQIRVRGGQTEAVAASDFVPVAAAVIAKKGGQLELRYHDIGATWGPALSHAGTFAQSARIRYGWGALDWRLSLSFELGQMTDQDASYDRRERWIGGDVRAEAPRLLGPIDVMLGAAWRTVDQSLTRRDGALVSRAGVDPSQRFTGFAAGPTASVGYRLGLGARFSLALEVRGTAYLRSEGGKIVVRPEVGPELVLRAQL